LFLVSVVHSYVLSQLMSLFKNDNFILHAVGMAKQNRKLSEIKDRYANSAIWHYKI